MLKCQNRKEDSKVKNSLAGKKKHPYISSDIEVSKSSPVISNTRVRVIDIVIEYDRLGFTPDQIIDAHPHLSLESIHDALSY